MTRCRWQYNSDWGWEDFQDRHQTMLDQAYADGDTEVEMKHRKRSYEVDIGTWTQRNIETDVVREIRWAPPTPAPEKLKQEQAYEAAWKKTKRATGWWYGGGSAASSSAPLAIEDQHPEDADALASWNAAQRVSKDDEEYAEDQQYQHQYWEMAQGTCEVDPNEQHNDEQSWGTWNDPKAARRVIN